MAATPDNVIDPIKDREKKVIEAIKTIFDPEIPVNIYELGLIYTINVDPTGPIHIRMTLTSPGCPTAAGLVQEVQMRAQDVPGVTTAKVDLVWDPPWRPDMMSEAAQLKLGIFE